MEIFLGAFTTQWEQRKAAFLHDLFLGRRPAFDEEERRRRGGAIATTRPASRSGRTEREGMTAARLSERQRATDRPMRARFAGLASGSQPAVVKLASFGGGGRLGAMVSYVSRNGAVTVENERGNQLHGRDTLSGINGEWNHLMSNRAESRDIGTFRISVLGSDPEGEDISRRAQLVVREALGNRAFAVAVAPRNDGSEFEIDGVVVLRSREGERLTADSKAAGLVQKRIDESSAGYSVRVQFTGYGNGTDYGTARLRSLVERYDGAVFNEQGRQIADSKAAGDLVQLEWRDQLHSRKPRDVMHVVLSARAGTDVEAFNAAARDFLGSQFGGHRYVFSLHDPSADPKAEEAGGKRPHVHVHAIVAMRSDARDRIETTIRTFREWRLALAESARKHGIDMEMTDRRDRASPAAYSQNQVRVVNTIGKTEHEGTSAKAQARYDAKRQDMAQRPTTERGHSYEGTARKEWGVVANNASSRDDGAFIDAVVQRLSTLEKTPDRETAGDAPVDSNSQFRTHLVKLSEIVSEGDMRHMTRPEFEAYEKRVETALFQAERAVPAGERDGFAEIAEAAREHVSVRRELLEVLEERAALEREDRLFADKSRFSDDASAQRSSEGEDRSADERDAAERALIENVRAREAVQTEARRGDDPETRQVATREVELALTKAAELGARDSNIADDAREIDSELKSVLQAVEADRARVRNEKSVDPERPEPGEIRGTPNDGGATRAEEDKAPKLVEEQIADVPRSVGDTTRGDPAKQHIPRLEELQREADERHHEDRDDRER